MITAGTLALLLRDLSIAVQKRIHLIVHPTETDMLTKIHNDLYKRGDAQGVALSTVIGGLLPINTKTTNATNLPIENTPIATPSLTISQNLIPQEHRISSSTLELLSDLIENLTNSEEFLAYSEERDRLSDPDVWKEEKPLLGLTTARD